MKATRKRPAELRDEVRCAAVRQWGHGREWRCARRGTVTVRGVLWCALHDPIAAEKRRQEASIRRGSRARARDNLALASHRREQARRAVIRFATEQVKVELEMHEKLGTPRPETPLVAAVQELELWQGRVDEREAEYLRAKQAVTTRGRSTKEDA